MALLCHIFCSSLVQKMLLSSIAAYFENKSADYISVRLMSLSSSVGGRRAQMYELLGV